MFNYDLETWINFFIGSFICCLGMFLSSKILLGKSFKEIKLYNYLLIIFLSILMIFNTLIFDNIMKIFGITIILFVIYRIIFKVEPQKSILYSIFSYFIILLGDLAVALLMSLILVFIKFDAIGMIIKTILGNLLVAIFMCLFALILRKLINKIINKLDNKKYISVVLLGLVSIFVLLSSLYKLSFDNWNISYHFVLTILIFVGCSILTIVLLKQNIQNKEITDKYKLLEEHLENSAVLIEKNSTTVHKYKNNLIAIKGNIKTDVNEALKYIDNLLEDYNNKKYNWIPKINYISMDTVRYLIYYKLAKAEANNLNISVDVSKDVKKYQNDIFTMKENNMLLDIIGELFDNAIYACSESKEKQLNFISYLEDNELVIMLSNTYKGKVDLSLITNNGYTTKGKGHGLGLYDIEKSIRKKNWININYELLDNYFVAKLIINKKNHE